MLPLLPPPRAPHKFARRNAKNVCLQRTLTGDVAGPRDAEELFEHVSGAISFLPIVPSMRGMQRLREDYAANFRTGTGRARLEAFFAWSNIKDDEAQANLQYNENWKSCSTTPKFLSSQPGWGALALGSVTVLFTNVRSKDRHAVTDTLQIGPCTPFCIDFSSSARGRPRPALVLIPVAASTMSMEESPMSARARSMALARIGAQSCVAHSREQHRIRAIRALRDAANPC